MKRSLTIGCVLLVGGGVTQCGGSAQIGSTPGAVAAAGAGNVLIVPVENPVEPSAGEGGEPGMCDPNKDCTIGIFK